MTALPHAVDDVYGVFCPTTAVSTAVHGQPYFVATTSFQCRCLAMTSNASNH